MTSQAPSFDTYMGERISYMNAKALNGFIAVCKWGNELESCVGSYSKACSNVDAFQEALDVSKDDAYEYLSVYGVDNWECGDGYNDVLTNYYCLENIHNYHVPEILACEQAMNVSMHSCTGQGCCSVISTFVQCWTNVYSKYCGKIGGYIGCNLAKIGQEYDYPNCASQLPKCSKTFSPYHPKFLPMHS